MASWFPFFNRKFLLRIIINRNNSKLSTTYQKDDKMQRPYRPRNFNRREPVVQDLREKLNKIKQEKLLNEEGSKNPPPPDPSYNFLKDPLRGDSCSDSRNEKNILAKDQTIRHEGKSNTEQKNVSKLSDTSPSENRRNPHNRGGAPRQRQNWRTNAPRDGQGQGQEKNHAVQQHSTKQQSVNNIKVIVSNESGERKCTIDNTLQVQVPVMVKKNYEDKPKYTKRSQQKYYFDRNKHWHSGNADEKSKENELKGDVTVAESTDQEKTSNESSLKKEEELVTCEKIDNSADDNKSKKANEEEHEIVETIKNDHIITENDSNANKNEI